MENFRTQLRGIIEKFIGVTVIILAITLVASGFAVTKINTDYMETGVRTAKIIAERENEEIFFSLNGRKFSPSQKLGDKLETASYFMPAPLNALVYVGREITDFINNRIK